MLTNVFTLYNAAWSDQVRPGQQQLPPTAHVISDQMNSTANMAVSLAPQAVFRPVEDICC